MEKPKYKLGCNRCREVATNDFQSFARQHVQTCTTKREPIWIPKLFEDYIPKNTKYTKKQITFINSMNLSDEAKHLNKR